MSAQAGTPIRHRAPPRVGSVLLPRPNGMVAVGPLLHRERHAFGILKQAVEAAPSGKGVSPEVLAHVLLASIIEIAMLIARSKTPRRVLKTGEEALDRLFAGVLAT
jgi:hypothetical protein